MRIKLIALVCFCLFMLSGCGKNGENQDSSALVLAAGGTTEYVIVRGDSASREEIGAAVLLRDAVLKETGIKIPIKTDWVKDKSDLPVSAKEILVGKTNRAESAVVLGPGECIVSVSGDRIVISGSGTGTAQAAAEFFVSAFVSKDGVYVPETTGMRFFIKTPVTETAGASLIEEEGEEMPLSVKIKLLHGIPRLYINDELTIPVLFFGNTDIGTNVAE